MDFLPFSGIEAADHLDGRVHYPFQRVWLDDFDGVAGGVIDAASSRLPLVCREEAGIPSPRYAHPAPARCGLPVGPGCGRG